MSQIEQIKKKIESKFNKPLFNGELNIFESHNDHKIFSIKLDGIIRSCIGSQVNISILSFDLKCSLL